MRVRARVKGEGEGEGEGEGREGDALADGHLGENVAQTRLLRLLAVASVEELLHLRSCGAWRDHGEMIAVRIGRRAASPGRCEDELALEGGGEGESEGE